jgi:PAS domain S-box-containing protein
MRLGLAAKLCLLAATLVFCATGAAGWLFFDHARTVVRQRALADLRAEADLRRRELLAAYDRARADLLAVAGAPDARNPAAPDARRRLERLIDVRPHYRELAVVEDDGGQGRVVAALEPTEDGWRPAALTGPRAWLTAADLAKARRLVPPAIAFSDVRRAGGQGELEQLAAARVAGPAGDAPWFAVLRIDFAALTRRLNQSPRTLGFLFNARGEYLAHPDPDRVLAAADAESDPLAQAFAQLSAEAEADGTPAGARLDEVALPGEAFFFATCLLPEPPTAARLRQVTADLLRRHPGLRASRYGDADGRWAFQDREAGRLRQVQAEFRQALGVPVTWDGDPYRCATFAAQVLPWRPEAGPVRPDAPPAPWLGLGLAAAHEEIEHDIRADYRKNIWLGLALSAAAAGSMLLFALYLTRPLRRMIGFADRVAVGQEADLELPQRLGGDEIGTLARAFRRMVEQVRGRTRELRESEARIRTILNTAAEGIVTIDEDGRLEAFNQAAERIFGYRAPEVRGQHFRKLLQRGAPDDMPSLLGTAAPTAGTGTDSSLMSISRVNGTTREVLARRRSGEAFPVEMSVSEVVLGDRLVYTAILRDITDRKQAEAQIQRMTGELEKRVQERTAELMQANQALESARDLALEANRAKDAFLAVMSHELRTPLNAIIGYCDYWLNEADEHDPHEMLDDLRKMHVSGKHLLALINDILDLAKIQAGKVVLEPADFALAPLLEDLKEWVEPLVRKNANTLAVACGDGLGNMWADRTRVRQVLLNLLSNAAKFTKGGEIRLEAVRRCATAVSAVSGSEHGRDGRGTPRDEIIFRVADTGVGMKPEDVKRLFQPFVQVDSSSTRKHEGTGLGLAICRKLCELMGGDIEVQSEFGRGTTFTVRLPARVAPPGLPGAKRDRSSGELVLPGDLAAPAAGEPATVLVVDDDPAARELLERVLTKEGYRVRTAPGGEAGLDLARRERPAAVVLDALMPGLDGWSVLGALKSDPATADIPVIMATVVDGHTRGFALGATDCITKPIDWDRLGVILRAYREAEPAGPVLVVEDDAAAREVTARHLRAQGWEVREAGDGREALARLRDSRPAVILLDLMMPNMDGFEFVEALRREPAWRPIPVVVVTAADLSAADRERLTGSVQQILQKGAYTPDQLLAEVRAQVRQCVVRRPVAADPPRDGR